MSVIYETLQKVKTQSGQDFRRDIPLERNRKALLLRKSNYFKPWVFGLAVLIFLSAMGVAYGIYQLKSNMNDGSAANVVTRKVTPQYTPTLDSEPLPGTTVDTATVVARYVPPVAAGKKSPVDAGKDLGDRQPGSLPHIKDAPTLEKRLTLRSEVANISRQRLPGRPDITTTAKTPSVRQPGYYDHGDSRRDKLHLANVKKSYRISRLIEQIHTSMQEMDHSKTEALLKQLASLKGPDSGYVLKLKSYWLLQQAQYKSAMSLLQKVLERNENDLEAGINMAIIEIKTDRLQQAGKRLSRLRENYPEDARIAEILNKLNSNPNYRK